MAAWQRFTQPGFSVTFEYPAVTPGGRVVERVEESVEGHPAAGDFERVHLSSPESGELYIEVTRFPGRTPEDEYRSHLPSLVQRFGTDAVTGLTATSWGNQAAWTYDFRWGEGERSVLLLQVGADTYRIIHDPGSKLNTRVLATLTVTD